MFYSMYYVLNSEFAQEDAAEPNTIIIRHSSGEYYWSYTPYYSQWTNQRWDEEDPQGYAYRFLRTKFHACGLDSAAGWI